MSYKVNLSEKEMIANLTKWEEQIEESLDSVNIYVDWCLGLLNDLDQIPVSADLLRKEPGVVVTIRKLRKFKFNEDIRKKSSELYEKFRSLFFVKDNLGKTPEEKEPKKMKIEGNGAADTLKVNGKESLKCTNIVDTLLMRLELLSKFNHHIFISADDKMTFKLINLEKQIQESLNYIDMNVEMCLELLNELDQLPISADILRKVPDVVVFIGKICKFETDENIKKKAAELYEKFQLLFCRKDIVDNLCKTPNEREDSKKTGIEENREPETESERERSGISREVSEEGEDIKEAI